MLVDALREMAAIQPEPSPSKVRPEGALLYLLLKKLVTEGGIQGLEQLATEAGFTDAEKEFCQLIFKKELDSLNQDRRNSSNANNIIKYINTNKSLPEEPPKKSGEAVVKLLYEFAKAYESKFNRKPFISYGGKDRSMAKTLLSAAKIEELVAIMPEYFKTQDRFVKDNGYNFGGFYAKAQGLLITHAKIVDAFSKKECFYCHNCTIYDPQTKLKIPCPQCGKTY